MRKGIFLIIIVMIVFYSLSFVLFKTNHAAAEGNTFYVSKTGLDTNVGSQASPWLTMQHAEDTASDGDTVYVVGSAEGETYTEGTLGGSEDIAPPDLSTLYLSKQITWIAVDKVNIASNHADGGFTMIINTEAKELNMDGFTIVETIASSGIFLHEGTVNVSFQNCEFTGAQFMFAGWTASISLDNCDMTTTNPFLEIGTSTISIDGGTYNITTDTSIFYGAAANINITNADFNITNSGSAKLLSLSGTSTATIDSSSFSIDSGSVDFVTLSGSGDVAVSNSDFVLPMNNAAAISSTGTGAVDLVGNTWNLSGNGGGLPTYLFLDTAETRRNTADNLIFNDNTVNINSQLGTSLVAISKRNSDMTLDGNHIVETDSTVTGVTQAILFVLNDLVSVTFQNNIIETIGSEAQNQLAIGSVDATWAGGTGSVYVGSNVFKTRSLLGTVLTVGADASAGAAYDNKWPGAIVEKNILYGPAFYNPSTAGFTLHGILIGQILFSHMRYNYVNGAGIGYGIKGFDWNGEEEGGSSDWNHEGGVYGNVAVNNVINSITNKGTQNLSIFNNTIYNNVENTGGIRIFGNILEGLYTYATGCHVYNNIVSSKDSEIVKIDDYMEGQVQTSYIGFEANNNLYWNNSGGTAQFIYNANVANGLSAWQTQSGQDADSILADPLFVESSMLGLELAEEVDIVGQLLRPFEVDATSPAIYQGAALPAGITLDYSGKAYASPPTIGASEHIAGPEFASIEYFSDSALTSSLGDNPRLKVGTYYLKITPSELLISPPTITIDAQGTANDVADVAASAVDGNNFYKYTREIVFDAASSGLTLEDISISGTDLASNLSSNVSPDNESSGAAYIDTIEPDLTILAQTISHVNKSVAISGTAVDSISGITSITINGDAVSLADIPNFTYTLTNLQIGDNEAQLIVQDGAGNSSVLAWIVRVTDLVLDEDEDEDEDEDQDEDQDQDEDEDEEELITPDTPSSTGTTQNPIAQAPTTTPSSAKPATPTIPKSDYSSPSTNNSNDITSDETDRVYQIQNNTDAAENENIRPDDDKNQGQSKNIPIVVFGSIAIVGIGYGALRFFVGKR